MTSGKNVFSFLIFEPDAFSWEGTPENKLKTVCLSGNKA